MRIILIIGIIISMLGLIGLGICMKKGLQVRKLERLGAHNDDDLKKMLGQLSIMNMLSLGLSFLGLFIIVISIILNVQID